MVLKAAETVLKMRIGTKDPPALADAGRSSSKPNSACHCNGTRSRQYGTELIAKVQSARGLLVYLRLTD